MFDRMLYVIYDVWSMTQPICTVTYMMARMVALTQVYADC